MISLTLPRTASLASFCGGLGALLMPKCPLCFAAYFSALSALGWNPIVDPAVVNFGILFSVLTSCGLVTWLGLGRGDRRTVAVSALGATLVLVGRWAVQSNVVTASGAVLLVGAALLNTLRCARHHAEQAPLPSANSA